MTENNISNYKTWVEVPHDSDFTIWNLPYGIFKTSAGKIAAGVAIGQQILNLAQLFELGYLKNCGLPESENVFHTHTLNSFIALGNEVWSNVRHRITHLLLVENTELQGNQEHINTIFVNQNEVEMLLPVEVPDYTDFYSSLEHASNVGKMFRPDAPPLLPNWKHMPIGYHGRSSSIVVSGTPFHRPKGQLMPDGAEMPVYGSSKQLDIELEMAFIVGKPTKMGESVSVENASKHIFGMVLFNDWSARDIQKWEYVPLGPFLGKNFASSVSPWIVTMEALEYFKTKGPEQDVEVLPYLKFSGNLNFDIDLKVFLKPENADKEELICESNHKYLYWNIYQQLAHHTVNGCNIRVGDMCASGTISAPFDNGYGSMLELTWRGTKPLKLSNGEERKFLNDGDTIIFRGKCEKNGVRIGFGEVSGKILPSI